MYGGLIYDSGARGRDRRKRMRAESTGHCLAQEFGRFIKNSKKLKRLFEDTREAIGEVIKGGYFVGEQLTHLYPTPEQKKTLYKSITTKVSIIVLGRSCTAKASVVNELFGHDILPNGVEQGPDELWRMVIFQKGDKTEISLSVPDSAYDLMDDLESYNEGCRTISRADLTVDGCTDPARRSAILEVKYKQTPLLNEDVQLIVSPSEDSVDKAFDRVTNNDFRLPTIVIYAVQGESLSSDEEAELRQLKAKVGSDSVFFVGPKAACMCDLTESEQHARTQLNRSELFQQLQNLGFVLDRVDSEGACSMLADSVEAIKHNGTGHRRQSASIVLFVRRVLHWMVVEGANTMNELHSTVLNMFILSAFEFIRDKSITPMRIEYAKEKEAELYKKLLGVAKTNQERVRALIKQTINDLHDEILEKCANFEFVSITAHEIETASPSTREKCAAQVQDFVLSQLSLAVADQLFNSMPLLKESFVGTLERCLTTLEHTCHLNHPEDPNTVQASHALRQILNAAYQLEVTVRTSSSILWVFLEKMRSIFKDLPGRGSPAIDGDYKRRVAQDLLDSLSDARLARSICAQFKEKLESSHERFVAAMAKLKADHKGRIDIIKNEKDKIRKILAPSIARYSLEAVSLRDVILYGMPHLGREIGRGQYGVVYSCDSWGMRGPLAIKSVVPPDDKHWNDLAMEFFYTRSLPPHDRLVPLRGSVIDYNYGHGTPAVLLIMDRLSRDLHQALHQTLSFQTRMRIALDVVQGIRFLHSQGLVHRDIKLKNVLLDNKNRAKITDLGFCKPNAMISGSVVGTPIHMAPELFTQKYDNRVDTYAFGILFWYLCSGKTELPSTFADCSDKDSLWISVRRGARPERLPVFSDAAWEVMTQCWHHDPEQRPHLGVVELRITAIMDAHRDQERQKETLDTMWSAEEAVESKFSLVH